MTTERGAEASEHPIRVVSRRTGLSPAVLRAWERRYGVVDPGRSDGGQRLYSDEEVRRLALLARLVEGGRSIGQVADLPDEELARLLEEDRRAAVARVSATRPNPGGAVAEAVAAVERFDHDALARILSRAALDLDPRTVLDEVVLPLLERIGSLWNDGALTPAHEHLATVVIRRFLDWMIGTAQPPGEAPCLVTTTPQGQRHELGALVAAAVGASEGWRGVFIGSDLPAREIAAAAERLGAELVAVSAVHPDEEGRTIAEIRLLRDTLPEGATLVVGGRGVSGLEAETGGGRAFFVLQDFDTFRRLLRHRRSGKPKESGART